MKPRLVLGLGAPLAGDDAIGLHLVQRLAGDPRLPPDVEVRAGGADLLRLADRLAGRRHVLLVDAVLASPGEVAPLIGDHPLPGLDDRQAHSHHLSAVQALELLHAVEPALTATRFTWFLVPIAAVRPGAGLTPPLADGLPRLVEALLSVLEVR